MAQDDTKPIADQYLEDFVVEGGIPKPKFVTTGIKSALATPRKRSKHLELSLEDRHGY